MILVETRNPKTHKNVHLSVTTMIVPKPITWRHLWLNHMVSTIFPEAPEDSMMSWWACGALSRGYWGPTTGRSHPASIPEKSSAAHSLLSSWSRSTAGHLSLTLPASFYWFAFSIMGTFYPFTGSAHGNMSNNNNTKCLNRKGSLPLWQSTGPLRRQCPLWSWGLWGWSPLELWSPRSARSK